MRARPLTALFISALMLVVSACGSSSDGYHPQPTSTPVPGEPHAPGELVQTANTALKAAPLPTVSAVDVNAVEGAQQAVVTFVRSGNLSKSSTISYRTVDDTAKAGVDYVARNSTLTFPKGMSSAVLTLPVLNDSTQEGPERYGLIIGPAGNVTTPDTQVWINVTDDDFTTPPVVPSKLGINDVQVGEAAGSAILTVSKTEDNGKPTTFSYATEAQTATAGKDFTPVSGTVTIPAGSSKYTISVPILNDTDVEANETLGVRITAGTNAEILKPLGQIVVVSEDSTTPPIPPVVGIPGAPDVPSNFDTKVSVRETTNIPQPNSQDVVGAFRFICYPGQLLYDDPVVLPGQPGKSHLHQFYGNTAVNANTTFDTLRKFGGSTCNDVMATAGQVAANRSGYWHAAMLDGIGNVLQPDYYQIYYKRLPAKGYCERWPCATIPNGLKFVFGFNTLTGQQGTNYPGHFICEGPTAIGKVTYSIPEQKALCPAGNRLEYALDTPKCWNGRDLDSADHRSHLTENMVSDPVTGERRCPDTHPVLIPQFTFGVFWSVVAGDDLNNWQWSTDYMFPNLAHGMTGHADYWEGWDNPVKMRWSAGCIDKMLNCSAGELGDGGSLINAYAPPWGYGVNAINPKRVVTLSSISGAM